MKRLVYFGTTLCVLVVLAFATAVGAQQEETPQEVVGCLSGITISIRPT